MIKQIYMRNIVMIWKLFWSSFWSRKENIRLNLNELINEWHTVESEGLFWWSDCFQHQSWTDDLPLCQLCGVGSALNCVYGPDGKGTQSHSNEDGHFRFRYSHSKHKWCWDLETLLLMNISPQKDTVSNNTLLFLWIKVFLLCFILRDVSYKAVCVFSAVPSAAICTGCLTGSTAAGWQILCVSVWQLNSYWGSWTPVTRTQTWRESWHRYCCLADS